VNRQGRVQDSSISRNKSERGIALILALLAILILSVLAASIIFLTQTGTWRTIDYRLTTQSRYAAEAGVQRTMNWFINSYTPPSDFTSYDMTKYPVQYSGRAVVLSGVSGVSANYPDSSVASAYHAALNSQAVPGLANTSVSTYATLLRMSPGAGVSWLPGPKVAQTWQITSQGNIAGLNSAQVQVVATYDPFISPVFIYGIAGDSTVCSDIAFSGSIMDSWNSAQGSYSSTHQNSGGNIATNGNITLWVDSTQIKGTLFNSSNITVGNCPNGITNWVGGTPWNGLQQLSQPLTYLAPIPPSPMTSTVYLPVNSNTCWGASPGGCSVSSVSSGCNGGVAPCVNIAPGSYGNIASSNSQVHLSAGTYYINSLDLSLGSVSLDSVPVVIDLGGNGIGAGGMLLNSHGSATIDSGGIPANLQIVTACCLSAMIGGQMANPPFIRMDASSAIYAVIYAPNARVYITGSSPFLGAVVSQKTTCDSSGGFSYDQALQNSLQKVGNFVAVSFSWSKF
jgi:hypothetical protein